VRKKKLLGWTLVIAAAAAAALLAPKSPNEAPAPERAAAPERKSAPALQASNPEQSSLGIPARDMIGRPAADPFSPRSWEPPAARRPAAKSIALAPEPPPPPAPPPMPYRVAGTVIQQGVPHIVLAKGDRVVTVRPGDVLEDGYRVESIDAGMVTLVYMPLDIRQQLAATAGINLETTQAAVAGASASPALEQGAAKLTDQGGAKLRWEGPARIRAGDSFNVALKVTSTEAVRSAPLQVSFDAAQLEAVDVRRGGFFADGSFSYRISPSGSIFIGASGKGAVPADAEFFVVTFKPVRAGVTELKLSSVLLQGAAGRAIAHDQPAAFRASIVQ
jgi:cohesin domain-containing protein